MSGRFDPVTFDITDSRRDAFYVRRAARYAEVTADYCPTPITGDAYRVAVRVVFHAARRMIAAGKAGKRGGFYVHAGSHSIEVPKGSTRDALDHVEEEILTDEITAGSVFVAVCPLGDVSMVKAALRGLPAGDLDPAHAYLRRRS